MGKVFLLFFLVTFSFFANAQVHLGFRGGINIANQQDAYRGIVFNGNQGSFKSFDGKYVTRFQGGIFADIPIAGNCFFRPNIDYSNEGYLIPQVVDYNGNLVATDIKVYLHYIKTPMQILYVPTLHFAKPWIGVGPYAGFLLSGNAKGNGNSVSLKVGNGDDDDIKRFDFGISATAGLIFNCGVLLGVDYNHGMVAVDPAGDLKSKNIAWSFYAGYRFRL